MSTSPTHIRSRRRRGQQTDVAQPVDGIAPRPREQLADDMTATLRANTLLNLCVRIAVAIFGLACAVSALVYAWTRADEFAALAGQGAGAVFALTAPFIMFVLLAVIAGATGYTVHARGLDETSRTLEALNRIEREGEVAVSARGLIFAFEEKLQNARRAFTLQLWLGRTMFIVCLGLLTTTILSAAMEEGAVAVATGAGSVFAAMLGVTKRVPHNVGRHLADVIQIQSIITGCDRQISLLESAALAALKDESGSGGGQEFVFEAQGRIDAVVENAVSRIQKFADPGFEPPSD